MAGPVYDTRTYLFGEFELDLDARQLRKGATPVRLERRPLDLLILLVSNHGRMVSREEIITTLWPTNVIIDFDAGLNTLIRKVRNALGDSPDEPRFVETVSGHGYRFKAPVAAATPAADDVSSAPPLARKTRVVPVLAILFLLAAGAAVLWLADDPEPEQLRIAVLPFENLTGDDGLDYLASGIAEETGISLARIDAPKIRVIGGVSARALASAATPLRQLGRELDLDFAVLSSLRLEKSRIRVTSRLVRVADGEQVWSASFDRELTNVLGLQRELSVAIAEQVRLRLSPEVAAAVDRRQTQNPAAYELYLKGRFAWSQFQPTSIQQSLEFYRQAVAIDPAYALAWAGIAHAQITSVATAERDRQSFLASAQDALQQALEFGPALAETQLALGSWYFFIDQDLERAEVAARQAVSSDPNSAMCHMFLGVVLSQTEKLVEARGMLRRARELDPLFPLMFANSAIAALAAGEPEEALEFATQAIAINPDFWVGHFHRGNAEFMLGNYESAIQAFARAEKLAGGNSPRSAASRAFILARLGRSDEARDVLAELHDQSAERFVSPYNVAIVYTALGETAAALESLEDALAVNDIWCHDLAREPMLEALRGDPRFEALINRCGRNAISTR